VPFVTVKDTRLFYRLEGAPGKPVLVLSHSIGTDHAMWAPQMPDLLQHFQVLRYDTRGHGASDVPPGEYSIEQLAHDVLALVDGLGISTFGFCGLSLGGMIGQWLGAHAPDRLTGLILANTSPLHAPASNWDTRRKLVLEGGMVAIVDVAMQRFFLPATLARADAYASSIRSVLLGTNPAGYAGCCSAIRDMNHTALLKDIHVPTMVIAGDRDLSTPWAGHGEILTRDIPGARAVHLPAAHLSNIERPHSFTTAIFELLGTGVAADPLEAGFAVRRRTLGDAHVDRSMAAANELTRDFQNLITRYAWGSVWARPGLNRSTRRLLTLAIAASLSRWEEFRLHLHAGLTHELEPCDVRETLLQTAIYAGVPAANTGLKIASEEIQKIGAESAKA
jgi:3-oxoadipate enol-lactonase / 4-carboxymuconolactone decarboxylase